MCALHLELRPEPMGICRIDAGGPIPSWALENRFFSATRTEEEFSVVCPEEAVPEGVVCHRGWRLLGVKGPLEFSEIGVLASLAAPLSRAGVPIFVVSTYETDLLLVRSEDLPGAVAALRDAGHRVSV